MLKSSFIQRVRAFLFQSRVRGDVRRRQAMKSEQLETRALLSAGTLDTTFDTDGIVTTPMGSLNDEAFAVTIQADGKTVAAGLVYTAEGLNFGIARFNTDGSLDQSFGSEGKVETQFGTFSSVPSSISVQLDGRIVVAGYAYNGSNYDFAIARYMPNGDLDASFGTGGKVTTAVGSGEDNANKVVIQPDGKILLGGDVMIGGQRDLAIVRYEANGSLDTTFGTGGIFTRGLFGSTPDALKGLALQPDGKIVASGYITNSGSIWPSLLRLNTNGTLDGTLNGDGFTFHSFGSTAVYSQNVSVLADGDILVGGVAFSGGRNNFAAIRYNDNGSLDSSFDGDGLLVSAIRPYADSASQLFARPDGKFYLGGTSYSSTDQDFALARYNPNGTLDSTFGTNGVTTTSIGTGDDIVSAMAVGSDGRIVLAGGSYNGTDFDFAVARYLGSNFPTSLLISSTQVVEGSPVATAVGTFSTVDPDAGETFTYSLVNGAGSTDNASFVIDGNVLKTNAVFDSTMNSSYSIRVRTTDNNGLWLEKTITLTVREGLRVYSTSISENGTLLAGHNRIHLTFSVPMQNADIAANYGLQRAGTDGLLTTTDSVEIPTSVIVSGQAVTLIFASMVEDTYRLIVRDEIVDSLGIALDGNTDRAPGEDWIKDYVVVAADGISVPYRFKEFSSYDQSYGWIMANNAAMFGGVHPSAWGDGGGLASQMSTDPAVLATLFNQKGYAAANAMLQGETWLSYSSTNSKHYAALFQIQNTTASAITWNPSFYYTANPSWGERASVAINGSLVWLSASDSGSQSTQTLSISIPANSTSTVVFVSASDVASGASRTNALGFFNNSLALPGGLTFVDELPAPIPYRFKEFSSYDQNYGWLMGDNAAMFGGVNPSAWGDGGASASQMSTDPAVLATLFNEKGYAAANAMLQAETWLSYSSTNSKHYAALFQIQNTTGSAITWNPSFYYTANSNWSERASVALNGSLVWQSTSDSGSQSTQTLSISIPANSTSTVIFVSASDVASGASRTNALGFFNNSLALPGGLTFVDELPAPIPYRFKEFSSYDQNYGWLMGDNAAMFGGVNPSAWGDGGGLASQMSTNPAVLAALFNQKGYAAANATLQAETWLSYSSTNSKHYAALFQIQNTTGSAITWNPSFYYTANPSWGESASVALNGSLVWQSTSNSGSQSTQALSISIPANSTSTVIFVSASDMASGASRTNALGFFNNSLALPGGLAFVDKLTGEPASVKLFSHSAVAFDIDTSGLGAGELLQGTMNAFDGINRLRVNGVNYAPAVPSSPVDGARTLVTGEQKLSGLDVAREITVPNTGSQAFSRTLEILTNSTDAAINVPVRIVGNLGSDAATTVFMTSDGDTIVEPTDLWFGTDDGDGTGTPAIIHLLHAGSGLQPSSVNVIEDNVEWSYSLTVPAGETKRLAHFTVLGTTRAAAIAAVNALVTESGFAGEAAAFLDAGELGSIVNFQFDIAPVDIVLSPSAVAENLPAGTVVGTLSSVDPGDISGFTYTLVSGDGDTDNASFTISTDSLLTAASFDREAKPVRSVRVRTTDQAGFWFEKILSVQIANVNEAPTALSLSNSRVSADALPGTAIGLFTTTDPDFGNSFTWTLASGSGDTDNATFQISGNVLLTRSAFDFDTQSTFSIRVQTADQNGLTFESTFTVTLVKGVATVVENLVPGGGVHDTNESSHPMGMIDVSGTIYFVADDGLNGRELWRISNSGLAEMVEDAVPGGGITAGSDSSYPSYLTNVNGTLYFQATDPLNGMELWRISSSGVAEMVEDAVPAGGINPGSSGAYLFNLTNVNGTLYFNARNAANGGELWRISSLGVAEMVEDAVPGGGINPGSSDSDPGVPTEVNGTLYFRASDGANGHELWRINNSGVAEMVDDAVAGDGINPGNIGSYPETLTNVNGTLYFQARDNANGKELWRINSSGVAEIVDDAVAGVGINPGSPGSTPQGLTNFSGRLYFRATDGVNGYELWRINSSGVAELVEDAVAGGGINLGTAGSYPSTLTEVNGTLYFKAGDTANGNELWRINSSGVAEMVEDAVPGGGLNPAGESSNPTYLTNINGTLYFQARNNANGNELWRINSSGVAELVEDAVAGGGINPAAGNSYPGTLTNVNGTLYFRANDGVNGHELWRVNSSGVAEMVDDAILGGGLSAGAANSSPSELTVSGGKLYFVADDGLLNGNEVWVLSVNTAPTNLTLSSTTIAENQPAGTTVGVFTTTDPDADVSFSYALIAGAGDTDNGAFTVNGNQLRTNAAFDFETKNTYSVRVRTTDSGGLSFERVFTITVNDVAEDVTAPVSLISALPAASTSAVIPISVTGTDSGAGASGVKEYDLYYSTGGAFIKFATVPAASPSTTFTGNANTNYWFRSLGRDNAGNVETKTTSDTYTRIGDVVPPSSQVTSAVPTSAGLFTVAMSGTKLSGSAMTVFDVYVAIDSDAPMLIGSAAAVATGGGSFTGETLFQGLPDGSSHTYRFFSVARDASGNVEAMPAATSDVSVTVSFASSGLTATGIDVQNGVNQRSYLRYLDVLFSTSSGVNNLLNPGRVKVERFGIDATLITPGTGTLVTGAGLTQTGNRLRLDFGATGLGGLRQAGNGFYRILLDMDGNGLFADAGDSAFEFHRLFGDANGDAKVDVADTNLVTSQIGRTGANLDGDLDGNGSVNSTDRLYTTQQRGKKLLDPLLDWLDD